MAENLVGGGTICLSQTSKIEVLGYHQITPEEITDLQEFLYSSNIVPVTDGATKRQLPSANSEK